MAEILFSHYEDFPSLMAQELAPLFVMLNRLGVPVAVVLGTDLQQRVGQIQATNDFASDNDTPVDPRLRKTARDHKPSQT
jgi:hypothetical protein